MLHENKKMKRVMFLASTQVSAFFQNILGEFPNALLLTVCCKRGLIIKWKRKSSGLR